MNAIRILVRLVGVVLIILGLLFWSGNAVAFIPIHMLLGLLLVLLLWGMTILAARTGELPGLVALGLTWGLIVPILGLSQDQLLPGPAHWIIRVIHLLVGVGAIALVEVLSRRALARTPIRSGMSEEPAQS